MDGQCGRCGKYLWDQSVYDRAEELRVENERLQAAHNHQHNMAGLMLREAERNGRQRDELLKAAEAVLGAFDEGRLTADDQYYLSDRHAIADLRAAIDAAKEQR